MKALLNGFESAEATFKASGKVDAGKAVALLSTGEVYYPIGMTDFTGIVASCRDDVASVIMKGYAVAKFKDTLPTVGICKLAPTSLGFMEVDDTNGKAYTVLSVDVKSKEIEFIL